MTPMTDHDWRDMQAARDFRAEHGREPTPRELRDASYQLGLSEILRKQLERSPVRRWCQWPAAKPHDRGENR